MALRQLSDKNLSGELTGINLGGVTADDAVAKIGDLTAKLESPASDGVRYGQKDAAWSVIPVDQMVWKGAWVTGSYLKHQVVRDRDWTMIANKDTEERPAPQPVGDPFYYFDGVLIDTQVTAKQIFFGNRYTPSNTIYLTGYRIKTIVGNHYEIYLIEDPLGAAPHTLLISFRATESGWKTFGVANVIVSAGNTFDMIAFVQEPDSTPITWVGNWNYITPNNSVIPLAGEVIHATKAVDQLWVSSLDDVAGDRYTELAALTAGDVIEAANQRWAIQSITDNTTYFIFDVYPVFQGAPTGVQEFTFETVTATPITYGKLTDYWLTNTQVSGLYIADGEYKDIVPDDHAYGMDVQVQQANLPDDWDVVAQSEGTSGSYDPNPLLTYDLVKVTGYTTSVEAYTRIAQLLTPNRVAGTYEFTMSWVWSIDTVTNSAFFRYMINNNGTWYTMRQETKDLTDVHYRLYGFPLILTEKVFQLDFEAAVENAGDVLTIDFCDLAIARVA